MKPLDPDFRLDIGKEYGSEASQVNTDYGNRRK